MSIKKTFLTLFSVATLTTILSALPEQSQEKPPGFYRLQVGSYQVTPLLDQVRERDPRTIATDPEAVGDALEANRISGSTTSCVNGFLLHTGEQLILVDAGMHGDLVPNITAAGYTPEQVSAVLITHLHPDHSTGLTKDGELIFKNAQVHCDKREADYWLDEANATPQTKERFASIRSALEPVKKAGKLKTFDGATQLFPSVRTIPAYGHTPGHTAYLLESEGREILFWGDTVHIEQAQFTHPELTVKFDSDNEQAAETRQALLKLANEKDYVIASPHISFPGLGQVVTHGEGYRWIPLPYGVEFK